MQDWHKKVGVTLKVQDLHKTYRIDIKGVTFEYWKGGKIHKKGVRLTNRVGLTPKVLNWHKLNIHKDIYIDKVGSNKSQKWQFRFKVYQCTKS